MNINSKILDIDKKLKELQAEKSKLLSLSDEQLLADEIHSAFCRGNHIDYCAYKYESWENPGYTKKSYLSKAKHCLEITDYKTAIKIINSLK